MARIPEAEIERIKSEVSLVRLIESSGLSLVRQGRDYAWCGPFHEETTASFVVTPNKNLFHCFGCGAAGGPIDWLMQSERLSFRASVERLRSELGWSDTPPAGPLTTAKFKAAPLLLAADADGQTALRQVLDYYHETLKQSPEALEYLQKRGLSHPELIAHFKLGYANRTLGYRLPNKAWKEGQEVRGRLQTIGILRDSGHEHLNGSIVVPVMDLQGVVHEVYGRKIRDDLRLGTAYHLYLPGPHAGVWNEEGVAASGGEVILCEALIDAMTFWVHGLRNVTASYGVGGFTEDHLAAFARHQVKRVLIAYDRDSAGNQAAQELAQKLKAAGIACYRVLFPKGMDANDYALKMTPSAKALALVVRKAEWMGEGRAPALTSVPMEGGILDSSLAAGFLAAESVAADCSVVDSPSADSQVPTLAAPLAAKVGGHDSALLVSTEREGAVQAAKEETDLPSSSLPPSGLSEPTMASPLPPAPQSEVPLEQTDTDLVLAYGDRRYRVRGWKKPLNPEALKVNLMVSKDEGFHMDTFDLYQAKARAAFLRQAGMELGVSEEVLKHDLGRVLLKLEELQTAQLQAALKKEDEGPRLSEAERAAALDLLQSPDLLDRILADFAVCGVVGEETNKLVGYLAAVVRACAGGTFCFNRSS